MSDMKQQGMKELHEAIDAAQRLLDESYKDVEIRSAPMQRKLDFVDDIQKVANMLRQLTLAITQAKPVGGNGEVH